MNAIKPQMMENHMNSLMKYSFYLFVSYINWMSITAQSPGHNVGN